MLNPAALESLKSSRRQLDMDGCEVGVSRQALEELIAAYEALTGSDGDMRDYHEGVVESLIDKMKTTEAQRDEALKALNVVRIEARTREAMPTVNASKDAQRGFALSLVGRLAAIERAARRALTGGKNG